MIISIVRLTDEPRSSKDDIDSCEIHVLPTALSQTDLAEYFATYGSKIDYLYDYTQGG